MARFSLLPGFDSELIDDQKSASLGSLASLLRFVWRRDSPSQTEQEDFAQPTEMRPIPPAPDCDGAARFTPFTGSRSDPVCWIPLDSVQSLLTA